MARIVSLTEGLPEKATTSVQTPDIIVQYRLAVSQVATTGNVLMGRSALCRDVQIGEQHTELAVVLTTIDLESPFFPRGFSRETATGETAAPRPNFAICPFRARRGSTSFSTT